MTRSQCLRCRSLLKETKIEHDRNHVSYVSACMTCGIRYELSCTPLHTPALGDGG